MTIGKIKNKFVRRTVIVVAYLPVMVSFVVCSLALHVIAAFSDAVDIHHSAKGAW